MPTGRYGRTVRTQPRRRHRPREGPMTRTALRICPLCEATCGLTVTMDGDRVTAARGDRDDVFSKGFICPKGAVLRGAGRRPRPAHPAPWCAADGALTEATWDEAFAAVRPGGLSAGRSLATGARTAGPPSPSSSATPMCTPWPGPSTRRCCSAPSRTRNVFTASTVDQMPKHVSSGLLYGDPLRHPRTGPGPHRPPPGHRRQPAGLQRQSVHRARLPGPAQGAAPPRRAADRHRPAPHPYREAGRPACGGPARHRRPAALRDGAGALRRGPGRPRGAGRAPQRGRRGRAAGGGLHARGRGDRVRRARGGDPAAGPRAGRRRSRRRVRPRSAPPPSSSARSPTGWSMCSALLTGNLDRPGGSDVPALRDRARTPPGRRPASGLRAGPLAQPGQRPPRGEGRAARRRAGRGDRHPRGRAASGPLSPSPPTPCCPLPDGDRLDAGAGRRSTSWSASTRTSTRPPATPMSCCRRPRPSRSPHFDFAFNAFAVRNQARYTRAAVPLARRAARRVRDPGAAGAVPERPGRRRTRRRWTPW